MKEVTHIFCTVLDKPDGHFAVTKAIELALQHEAKLTFVTVINAEFLGMATPVLSSIDVVFHQLHELGEFTMSLLCEQANQKGVKDVDFIIREGKILLQLRELVSEAQPDILVLGRPIDRGKPVFSVTPEEIEDFLSEVRSDYNVEVVAVEVDPSSD